MSKLSPRRLTDFNIQASDLNRCIGLLSSLFWTDLLIFNARWDKHICHEHLTASRVFLGWTSESQPTLSNTDAFLLKNSCFCQNSALSQHAGRQWKGVGHGTPPPKDQNDDFFSKHWGHFASRPQIKQTCSERSSSWDGSGEKRAQNRTADQKLSSRQKHLQSPVVFTIFQSINESKTQGIWCSILRTNGKQRRRNQSQHLLFRKRVFSPLRLVRCRCQRQRCADLVSGLLFCTTCCLAQPCLETRGGRERGGEAGVEPWLRVCHHRVVVAVLTCDSRSLREAKRSKAFADLCYTHSYVLIIYTLDLFVINPPL